MKRQHFRKGPFFLALLVLLGLSMGSCTESPETQAPTTPELTKNINFALDWIPYCEHAGFYVALEKGFYSQKGLSVQISRGYGSSDTLKRIQAGTSDIGLVDVTTLIVAKANEPSITAREIGILFQKSPYNAVFVKGRKIETTADLAHATWGGTSGAADTIFYPAFLKLLGIDTEPPFVAMDAGAKSASLVADKVDVVPDFITVFPNFRKAAEQANVEVDYFLFADYGVDLYSIGIVTSEEMIETDPDSLRKFLEASFEGWMYTIENPQEATAILKKHNPEIDEEAELEGLALTLPLVAPADAYEFGLGYMTDDRMRYTLDLTQRYFDLDEVPRPEEVYTNQFLVKMVPPPMNQ